jgi:deoxycytidylate deaminase
MNAVLKAVTSQGKTFNAQRRIDDTLTAEIVIALCGPMGTPLHSVAEKISKLLKGEDYQYGKVEVIRLSDRIREYAKLPEGTTTSQLIEAGNSLRQKHGNAYLSQIAIKEIALARAAAITEQEGAKNDLFSAAADVTEAAALTPAYSVRHCHIIDSIKTLDELRLLRSVYGDMLHVVGLYAPIDVRIQRLANANSSEQVHNLINRDSGEEVEFGQRVRDTFPLADFFLRADTNTDSQLEVRIRRFLDLMLGKRIITPTIAERAMYAAHSAARNSACLSRQVGAAITNQDGDLLATGWNDVPKPFGGLYQSLSLDETSDSDHRCWNKDGGKCFNDEEKTLLSKTIADSLIEDQVVDESQRAKIELSVRENGKLKGLIEFSRAVHAEMHALLNAGSTNGSQISGGKLFVTTYPCHSCARHIVAAGIKEVYFVEPYRKSLATKLHPDAITESETDLKKVRIIPFDGVAPSRFLKFFSAPLEGRKNPATGKMRDSTGRPVTAITLEAIETLEGLALKGLESTGLGS